MAAVCLQFRELTVAHILPRSSRTFVLVIVTALLLGRIDIVDAAYCDTRRRWLVCLSVTRVSPAKMGRRIEMPLGAETCGAPH